jgi:predicted small secreted protein
MEEKMMKKTFLVAVSVLVAVLVFSCGTTGGSGADRGGVRGGWAWYPFTDAANGGSSRITIVEDIEMIDGEPQMTYTISGEITNQYQYGYAGFVAVPDEETLELLKTAKAFSFKVIGDGEPYWAKLCTSDIEDSAFYGTQVLTRKDREITAMVRVGSLQQPDDWGIKKKFDQDQAFQLQWQTTNNGRPGTFRLKIWDVRLHD